MVDKNHTYESIKNQKEEIRKIMYNHFQNLNSFLTKESEQGATDKDSEVADLVNWYNLLDDLFVEVKIMEEIKNDSNPAVTGVESNSNKTRV